MAEGGKTPIPGQFMGPTGNTPRAPREKKDDSSAAPPVAPPATSPRAPDIDEEIGLLQNELDATPEEDSSRPPTREELEKMYVEGLEQVGLKIEEARNVMEEVLIKGFFQESHRVGPLTITLRTRSYNDTLRAQRSLESESPTYNANVNDLVARYNVAASLVRYGDNVFEHPEDGPEGTTDAIEAAFRKRLNFVMARPSIVMAKLMELVYTFDLKIAAVFAEGAPQDF